MRPHPRTRLGYWWLLWRYPSLCDACDRVRRGVWSTDGRTLVCARCRARHPLHSWRMRSTDLPLGWQQVGFTTETIERNTP